jgi:hypothetical protein
MSPVVAFNLGDGRDVAGTESRCFPGQNDKQ